MGETCSKPLAKKAGRYSHMSRVRQQPSISIHDMCFTRSLFIIKGFKLSLGVGMLASALPFDALCDMSHGRYTVCVARVGSDLAWPIVVDSAGVPQGTTFTFPGANTCSIFATVTLYGSVKVDSLELPTITNIFG